MACHDMLRDLKTLRKIMESRKDEKMTFDEGMWSLCSERADRLIERGDYGEMRTLYLHMAEFLGREGKDCACVLEEAAKARLLQLREEGVTRVAVVCREDACPACRAAAGRHFDVEDALRTSPVPVAGCSHSPPSAAQCSYCRCEYTDSR